MEASRVMLRCAQIGFEMSLTPTPARPLRPGWCSVGFSWCQTNGSVGGENGECSVETVQGKEKRLPQKYTAQYDVDENRKIGKFSGRS